MQQRTCHLDCSFSLQGRENRTWPVRRSTCRVGQNGVYPILPDLNACRALLVDTLPPPGGCDLAVWVPSFRGLIPALADVAALLPVRAVNEALVQAMRGPVAATPPVVAGILAVDPFLNGSALYRTLADHGVAGVVNMPSVFPADGALGQALRAAKLGSDQELQMLVAAGDHGLEPLALVFSHAEAAKASASGIRRILLHPGLPSGEARLDRKLADSAAVTLDRLRGKGHDVLLYRHPELDDWLPGNPATPGQLVWHVSGPDGPQPSP